MNDLSKDCELIDLHPMTYAPNMISQMITDFYPEKGNMRRNSDSYNQKHKDCTRGISV